MNISVIGASAGTGLETVKRALARNHEVTTLSRSAIPIPKNSHLHPISGSALKKEDLAKAIENADAVIVALGTSKNRKETTLFSDFAKLLVRMHDESPTDIPFVFVTGWGVGESHKYVGLPVKLFIRFYLKKVYADKNKMEKILSGSALNWIIIRPGQLLDGELTEKYHIETSLRKGIKMKGINRSDLADYMVKQAENPTESRKFVLISGEK